MKIGVSAFAWTSRFRSAHLRILPELQRLGVEALEIPMLDPELLPISDIREATTGAGLECTACALMPSDCNPISTSRSSRERAREHLRRCIDACSRMGASLLCGPLYAPIGYLPDHRPTPEEWSWAVEMFQALGDDLEAHDVRLAIEPVNRSETSLLRTVAEATRLCDSIDHPRIGITLDTFHGNIEERDMPGAVLEAGDRLMHVHASENDRGPLGRGHVPFHDIIAALQQVRYSGYLMVEGFGFDSQEKEAPGRLWADPTVSPETLAAESTRYLRSILKTGPA